MYRGSSNHHWTTIGGQRIFVDSNLEERVLQELEATGFTQRWSKPEVGLSVRGYNYTPDIELSVQFEGMTHRALVEIKPNRQLFTNYISRRMRHVARYYFSDLLLLYVDTEKQWYRVDQKTGALSDFGQPVPGTIPLKKLYKPIGIPARQIYNHRYKKRLTPMLSTVSFLLESIVLLLQGPRKAPRQGSRHKK
jgi:hypothetical protein